MDEKGCVNLKATKHIAILCKGLLAARLVLRFGLLGNRRPKAPFSPAFPHISHNLGLFSSSNRFPIEGHISHILRINT